ncbi:uncharacterized protein LOC116456746 [Hylobates moloch]|uniref:uncharacterized protein LOC116456746 n=1 Tax=Hylobates moloch TaxID=81572 RepID=UPI002675F91C|nr:uncharacterized protein LOC116456746 [Hylobates moloch]
MALRDMEFKIPFKSTRNTKIPLYFHTRKIQPRNRNTHKHPTRGPSYRGGIAAGPGTNSPVGGGVPPCGLVVSEQNADRKCSCRNDSLRRRQTLTTTPSSPLHFRHRRRRRRCRHLGSRPRLRRAAPRRTRAQPGPAAGRRQLSSTPRPRRAAVDVASIVDASERRLPCDTGGPALLCLYFPGGRQERRPSSVVVVSVVGTQARTGSQVADGGGWRPRWLSQVAVSFREPISGRPHRGRPRFDGDDARFKWCPCSRMDGWIVHLAF